jgi:hypothetical protein
MFMTMNSVDCSDHVNRTCVWKWLRRSTFCIILIFPCISYYATELSIFFLPNWKTFFYACVICKINVKYCVYTYYKTQFYASGWLRNGNLFNFSECTRVLIFLMLVPSYCHASDIQTQKVIYLISSNNLQDNINIFQWKQL